MLVTSDWHLDENPDNAYRWDIFDHLQEWLKTSNDKLIIHCGDLTDRKDRHSAELVNALVVNFQELVEAGAVVYVLMGNHDKPLNGTPYWSFLSALSEYITFVTTPQQLKKSAIALLPYSDDPATEWAKIDFTRLRAAFMHQTVTGATGNNGIVLQNEHMPTFPKSLKVWSGDIHTPQKVGLVQYIGSPHPVAFGDDYPCRMLDIDPDTLKATVIELFPLQKLMLRLNEVEELDQVDCQPGDQAKVIVRLDVNQLDLWPAMQDRIKAWANEREVQLFSIEADINGTLTQDVDSPELDSDPQYILRLFADAENIDDRMFKVGAGLLKEVQ